MEDSFVKAVLVRGVINKDSLVQKEPEAILIDIYKMRAIRDWLKAKIWSMRKSACYGATCVCTFMPLS